MNTSLTRIPSQCGSVIVVWRSYMYISLTKYSLNCHLQLVDLNRLIKESNPELPFQSVFTFMRETWNEVSSLIHISTVI